MKSQRHTAIFEIISSERINTQEALTQKLRERGFSVTQATVSRDINQLHLIKKATPDGSYAYAVQSDMANQKNSAKYKSIMRETIMDIRPAGNIVVIKTYTGMANAAAAAIDATAGSLAVGTIAGDDTIFIATSSEDDAKIFIATVKNFANIV